MGVPSWPQTCGISVNTLRELGSHWNFQGTSRVASIACAKLFVMFCPQGLKIWHLFVSRKNLGVPPSAISVSPTLGGWVGDTEIFKIFTCGEADRSSRDKFFFFLLNESSKEGQNSPNKHGSICSLGHKFQIWGQISPLRLFGGHSGLKTSFSLLVSDWWKFIIFSQRTSFSPIDGSS